MTESFFSATVEFANTVVVKMIREEIKHLGNWCPDGNPHLNVSKTKELIINCSKKQSSGAIELFIGVHIKQDLLRSCHISSLTKKAYQCHYHLR